MKVLAIIPARKCSKGERTNKNNLTVKRPGIGISPMFQEVIIGINL